MSMSNHHQCLVPNWNLKQKQEQERQEQVEVFGEEGNPATTTHLVPMLRSNYDEVAELTWKNGHLSIDGLVGLLPNSHEKPTWGNKAHDTLESLVQQATKNPKNSKFIREQHHCSITTTRSGSSSMAASSSREQYQLVPTLMTRRKRSCLDWDQHGRNFERYHNHNHNHNNNNMVEEYCDIQIPSDFGCASASATFYRDNEATLVSWASLESGQSLKDQTLEEDSPCHYELEIQENQDDRETKAERGQSNSTRRTRTAAIHNQSEMRRRDRINRKMKALQRLVPNASKTDKASMLEEVIKYLKQLQAQIQMMRMQHMMVPLAMQQQIQMSMLARINGLSLGMGNENMVNNINNNNIMASPHTTTTTTSSRSFPQLIQQRNIGGASSMMPSYIQSHHYSSPPKLQPSASSSSTNNASIPLLDPFSATTTFAQPMNMDLLNMAALYRQQQIMSYNNETLSSFSQTNHDDQANSEEIN